MSTHRAYYIAQRLMSPGTVLATSALQTILLFRIAPHYLPIRAATSSSDTTAAIQLILVILLFNTTLVFLFKWLIYNHFISPLRSFPSPKGRNFFIGWFQSIVYADRMQQTISWAAEPCNTEGAINFRTAIGTDKLFVTGPKPLQEILVTNAYDWRKPAAVSRFLGAILGNGLVVSEGEEHKFQRKHVKPAFGFRQIRDLYPMMWSKSVLAMDRIAQDLVLGKGSVEVEDWATKITLDIIGVAGLGRDFRSLQGSDDPLVRTYEELFVPSYERFLYFILRIVGPDELIQKLPWRMNSIFKRTTKSLKEITSSLVREKQMAMKTGSSEHVDILALLIESGNFNEADLVDQMLTFLAAGIHRHDTTTAAFTWALFLLSRHPCIQSQLRAEIQSSLSPSTNPSDIATTLERLPLLHGVLNETLRLYPTVPFTERESIRSTVLLDRTVPAGTNVILAPWTTNKLPSLWGADAESFTPERWINAADNTPNNHGGMEDNYAFMTFLHGPRSCIGQGFAKAELKCLLAAFVGRFEFELDMLVEDVVPSGAVTIKPAKGLKLKVRDVTGGEKAT